MPVNPSKPAIMAIIKNVIVQLNIRSLSVEFEGGLRNRKSHS
jgi:hypothetical protein